MKRKMKKLACTVFAGGADTERGHGHIISLEGEYLSETVLRHICAA